MKRPKMHLRDGALVAGRFRIIRLLGRGGMGAVFEATNEALGSVVALKQHLLDDSHLSLFMSEARLLHHLDHPSLPRVWDVFSAPDGHFIVMDYIDGDDLAVVLAQRGPRLGLPEVVAWADQLLEVLDYLHTREPPVIHRDIKPQNVKLARDGNIKLLDFGLAKGLQSYPDASGKSVTGYTLRYSSPEQIGQRGTDARSDLYSLAVTLYHLLAGHLPSGRTDGRQLAAADGNDIFRPIHLVNPAVPEHISQVLHAALSLDPDQRPSSALELRHALHADSAIVLPSELNSSVLLLNTQSELPPASEALPALLEPVPQPQVWYDIANRWRDLSYLLDTFIEQIFTERMRDSLGNDVLGQLRTRERQLRARADRPFTLVVLGNFKRGKSTLINALLGQDVVTTNVTPETITVNHITYGPQLRVTGNLDDGGQVLIAPENLLAERLEPFLKQLPRPVSHLTIEAPINWLRGMTLVDMPGLGDLDWRFDQQVQSYLPEADAVIFVISAVTLLSANEQAFLRLAVAPQSFPRLIFVVNMIDKIAKENDLKRILALMSERVSQLFPEATVYGVSAQDERARKIGARRPAPARVHALETGFAQLRSSIDELVLMNRDVIRIDRSVAQTQAMLRWLTETVTRLHQAVERDASHLAAMIAQCEDNNSALHQTIQQHSREFEGMIADLGNEAIRWMDEFVDRFDSEVIAHLSQFNLGSIQRHFHFFTSDSLSAALNRCVEAHEPIIVARLAAVRGAIHSDVSGVTNLTMIPKPLDAAQLASSAVVGQQGWNNLDTLHLVASIAQPYLFGYVGQMLMSGAFMLADRMLDDPQQIVKYQKRLRVALPELRASIRRELTALYQQIADKVLQEVDQAFTEEIAASLAAIRQAQAIHQDGSQRVAQVKQIYETTIRIIEHTQRELDHFQGRLWPSDQRGERADG